MPNVISSENSAPWARDAPAGQRLLYYCRAADEAGYTYVQARQDRDALMLV